MKAFTDTKAPSKKRFSESEPGTLDTPKSQDMEGFLGLGLSKEVTDVLAEQGFTEPTEIQEKAIPLALEGKDIIGGSATGSGKTLAFASPILEKLVPGKGVGALILTPTRELAEQVASSLRDFGKRKGLDVLAVYGGVDIEKQIRGLKEADVVVGTPGRILDHMERKTIDFSGVKFLVLDEVDRMFDMGFYEDVEKILKSCPKDRQTMLFSATISWEVKNLAKEHTKGAAEVAVDNHVDASLLKQEYYDVPQHVKFSLLVHLLKKENAELVMVFCDSRRNVDFVAGNLNKQGIEAHTIHGGMSQDKRLKVLKGFHEKGVHVLVCTDVAARGLDISGVSHVYNYDLPGSKEDYVHRIGRTARAGAEGKAIAILSARDYKKFQDIADGKGFTIERKNLPKLERVHIDTSFGQRSGGRSQGRFTGGRGREGGVSRGPPRSGGSGFGSRGGSGGRSSGPPRSGGSSRSGSGARGYSRDRPQADRRDGNGREGGSGDRGFGSRREGSSGGRREGGGRSFGGGSRGGSGGGRSFGGSGGSRGRSSGGSRFGARGGGSGGPRRFGGASGGSRFGGSSGGGRFSRDGGSGGSRGGDFRRPRSGSFQKRDGDEGSSSRGSGRFSGNRGSGSRGPPRSGGFGGSRGGSGGRGSSRGEGFSGNRGQRGPRGERKVFGKGNFSKGRNSR